MDTTVDVVFLCARCEDRLTCPDGAADSSNVFCSNCGAKVAAWTAFRNAAAEVIRCEMRSELITLPGLPNAKIYISRIAAGTGPS